MTMKRTSFVHEFVEFIPSPPLEGRLYVSIPYATAVHLCACGCGNKVVTPISPAGWQLFFDGETVSLTPSIGNWSFPCRSHYWIKSNIVRWAGPWSDKQVADGRARDARNRDAYFARRAATATTESATTSHGADRSPRYLGPLARLRRWLRPGS